MAKYVLTESGNLKAIYPDAIKDVPRVSTSIRARLKALPNAPSVLDTNVTDAQLKQSLFEGLNCAERLHA